MHSIKSSYYHYYYYYYYYYYYRGTIIKSGVLCRLAKRHKAFVMWKALCYVLGHRNKQDRHNHGFMTLMVCLCACVRVCVCIGLHIVYKQNKTKLIANISKMGGFIQKSRFLASFWKHRKIWEEVRSLSTGQPAPPDPSQIAKHSASLPPEMGRWLL